MLIRGPEREGLVSRLSVGLWCGRSSVLLWGDRCLPPSSEPLSSRSGRSGSWRASSSSPDLQMLPQGAGGGGGRCSEVQGSLLSKGPKQGECSAADP